jgi:hypothetical protein
MKVRIEIVLEIDPNAYNAEYNTKLTPREVANDVREGVFSAVESVFPQHSKIVKEAKLVNR